MRFTDQFISGLLFHQRARGPIAHWRQANLLWEKVSPTLQLLVKELIFLSRRLYDRTCPKYTHWDHWSMAVLDMVPEHGVLDEQNRYHIVVHSGIICFYFDWLYFL